MKEKTTEYGHVYVLTKDEIFEKSLQFIEDALKKSESIARVALTGGSTPKAFYRWMAVEGKFPRDWRNKIHWFTSDERYVPISHDDSNFGTADKLFLQLMGIEPLYKKKWATDKSPEEAINDMSSKVLGKAFDVCFLGMGDDCHTASIFPGSPLIGNNGQDGYFAAVDVPDKGMRLTITPKGLEKCDQIVVIATGAGKKEALKRVFLEDFNPTEKPVQLLKTMNKHVTWLLDEEAASGLNL